MLRESIRGRKAAFGRKRSESQSAEAGQSGFAWPVFASQRQVPLRGQKSCYTLERIAVRLKSGEPADRFEEQSSVMSPRSFTRPTIRSIEKVRCRGVRCAHEKARKACHLRASEHHFRRCFSAHHFPGCSFWPRLLSKAALRLVPSGYFTSLLRFPVQRASSSTIEEIFRSEVHRSLHIPC